MIYPLSFKLPEIHWGSPGALNRDFILFYNAIQVFQVSSWSSISILALALYPDIWLEFRHSLRTLMPSVAFYSLLTASLWHNVSTFILRSPTRLEQIATMQRMICQLSSCASCFGNTEANKNRDAKWVGIFPPHLMWNATQKKCFSSFAPCDGFSASFIGPLLVGVLYVSLLKHPPTQPQTTDWSQSHILGV